MNSTLEFNSGIETKHTQERFVVIEQTNSNECGCNRIERNENNYVKKENVIVREKKLSSY